VSPEPSPPLSAMTVREPDRRLTSSQVGQSWAPKKMLVGDAHDELVLPVRVAPHQLRDVLH